ncbi:hypothetical protein DEU56DRAFT_564681 [Suillus clintonianus]|uniref:uncharacterized protein n=1 Tax=Suillus clintonianus TaxID=1904413 RepID=UPI001B879F84|nr:uncharacterized protein DEU56DRAFT_564681 [Suillus clintonianus]KAG2125750.1 hypothetical protein DEU56DRAFT_564681 [Suillus clintonianus]
MSSEQGAYDQNLLDKAPAATRAQRQEGYNVDLLDDRPTRPTSTQLFKPPPIIAGDTDVESSSLTREKVVPATHPTQSFWRSRNGKIIMFVIAVVVVGAVVGGAVGGTAGKLSSNNSAAPPQNATSESNSTTSTTSGSKSAISATSSDTTGGLTSIGVGGGGQSIATSTASAFPGQQSLEVADVTYRKRS